MFLDNKYTKWYNSIIQAAIARKTVDCYVEHHHIIPRSLGGSDKKSNIAILYAREHFICHMLLVKMVEGSDRAKMAYAANRMLTYSTNHERYMPASRLYQFLKEEFSKQHSILMSNLVRTEESNIKRSNTQKGCKSYIRTEETINNMKATKLANPQTPWNKGKSTPLKGLTYDEIYGVEKAQELKQLRSLSLKGKAKSESTKAIWSQNRKGKTTGGSNPNATPVTINGITYSCKKDACNALSISLYKLSKLV